jgi:hypothetical protein
MNAAILRTLQILKRRWLDLTVGRMCVQQQLLYDASYHRQTTMNVPLSNLPFKLNHVAKARGASFDKENKRWVARNPLAFEACREWLADPDMECPRMPIDRRWVFHPFEERAIARRKGLIYDRAACCYYVHADEPAVCEIDTTDL